LNKVLLDKARGVIVRKVDAYAGRFYSLERTLDAMSIRPYELHLELTNLCNANCIFCPYQFQERDVEFMADDVFEKAVTDFVSIGGGSVGLTPIVGDALIDPKFLKRVKYLRSHPEIDRIFMTTNAILLDKHGVSEVLQSGLTSITISTAGFDKDMYERVYRSQSYERMRKNVFELVKLNAELSDPIHITVGLRADRPLQEVMKYPDFQPILKYRPAVDFTWSFTSANGRITREMLPAAMKLRVVKRRREACVQLYNGPIVLPDGTVMGCSCVASMDATRDLGIGNIMESSLGEIWTSSRMKTLRSSFKDGTLNPTCSGCDMYRDLEKYRRSEGRERARINRLRDQGVTIRRKTNAKSAFAGG
jgi:radical SAM protein with 4Fe4S-binding SPASM domain